MENRTRRGAGPCAEDEVTQRAAEWLSRMDGRPSPENWKEFNAWLEASPQHHAAFVRLSVAWERLSHLRRLALPGDTPNVNLLAPDGDLAGSVFGRRFRAIQNVPHTLREPINKLGYAILVGMMSLALAVAPGGINPFEAFIIGAVVTYCGIAALEHSRFFIGARRNHRP